MARDKEIYNMTLMVWQEKITTVFPDILKATVSIEIYNFAEQNNEQENVNLMIYTSCILEGRCKQLR